jgi:hypothetical protein
MLTYHLMIFIRTFLYINLLEAVKHGCRHVGMCFVSQLQELGSQLTLARTGQTRSHSRDTGPVVFWFIRVCFL